MPVSASLRNVATMSCTLEAKHGTILTVKNVRGREGKFWNSSLSISSAASVYLKRLRTIYNGAEEGQEVRMYCR